MSRPLSSPLSSAEPSRQAQVPASVATLDSAVLFGQHDEVLILHAGETYRLRRTRLGKLILTK